MLATAVGFVFIVVLVPLLGPIMGVGAALVVTGVVWLMLQPRNMR